MNAFKVTYTDGSSYVTSANGTLEEFTAYLMQFGGVVVDENLVTGEETRRYIERVDYANSFPTNPSDPFYRKFDDPLRAYSNLPGLYKFYLENPDTPRPNDSIDHINYAWDKAHEAHG